MLCRHKMPSTAQRHLVMTAVSAQRGELVYQAHCMKK